MPEKYASWKQNSSTKYDGEICIKEITRTVTLRSGEEIVLKKTIECNLSEPYQQPRLEVFVPTRDGPPLSKHEEKPLPEDPTERQVQQWLDEKVDYSEKLQGIGVITGTSVKRNLNWKGKEGTLTTNITVKLMDGETKEFTFKESRTFI